MRKKFVEELLRQPSQNNGNNGTKINLHFPLRGDIATYCVNLNKDLQTLTKSEIDFSPNSFHVPHLTLCMGYIHREEQYKIILNEIFEFAQKMSVLTISMTKPYLKKPGNNYIFIDAKESSQIIEVKRNIYTKIDRLIEPLNWDVVNEPPHITVGYIKGGFEKVEQFLASYPEPNLWCADSIEMSFCGKLGTCLGAIRSFEFPAS